MGGQEGLYFALFFSLLMNGISYFFSDKIALMASGAKPLSKKQSPEIYSIVEDLSQKMQMPMPKLFITPATQANAFATGRSPNHASVAVTKGIIDLLPPEEIKAVLAHELAHVKNRDILIASVAAVLASTLTFISRMGLYGGYGGSEREEGNNRSGTGLALLLAFVAPIAAMLIQFAISRQREFGADESGAKIIGDGKPLAKALIAIHDSAKRSPLKTNPAFSSLYIGNPLGGIGGTVLALFSTHPPVEERVKRLRNI